MHGAAIIPTKISIKLNTPHNWRRVQIFRGVYRYKIKATHLRIPQASNTNLKSYTYTMKLLALISLALSLSPFAVNALASSVVRARSLDEVTKRELSNLLPRDESGITMCDGTSHSGNCNTFQAAEGTCNVSQDFFSSFKDGSEPHSVNILARPRPFPNQSLVVLCQSRVRLLPVHHGLVHPRHLRSLRRLWWL